jgi:DNA-binding response OmpR family regulator
VRVLLVEDEKPLATALRRILEAEGFSVVLAANGVDGRWQALEHDFDVVILDVMLPGVSGYDVCTAVRQAGKQVPILFLTAKDGEYDEADALDLGADDFLSKPVSPVVLVAHLRALLRRSGQSRPAVVSVGDLRIDPGRRRTWVGQEEIALTPRELSVLTYLSFHAEQVVSKSELLEHVWDPAFDGADNVVEVYIGHLRRKLAGAQEVSIETVRGAGYRLRARAR